MEWKAGCICGALPMPRTNVIVLTNQVAENYGGAAPVAFDAPAGRGQIEQVGEHFQVSEQAVQVRLSRLGFLSEK